MAEPKTQKTKASVSAFIAAVEDETRRKDAKAVDKMMREITGEKPAMWGPTIVGYGESNAVRQVAAHGLQPAQGESRSLRHGWFTECKPLLKKLGKHKTGSELPLHQQTCRCG